MYQYFHASVTLTSPSGDLESEGRQCCPPLPRVLVSSICLHTGGQYLFQCRFGTFDCPFCVDLDRWFAYFVCPVVRVWNLLAIHVARGMSWCPTHHGFQLVPFLCQTGTQVQHSSSGFVRWIERCSLPVGDAHGVSVQAFTASHQVVRRSDKVQECLSDMLFAASLSVGLCTEDCTEGAVNCCECRDLVLGVRCFPICCGQPNSMLEVHFSRSRV